MNNELTHPVDNLVKKLAAAKLQLIKCNATFIALADEKEDIPEYAVRLMNERIAEIEALDI